jgi:hypothetical protein
MSIERQPKESGWYWVVPRDKTWTEQEPRPLTWDVSEQRWWDDEGWSSTDVYDAVSERITLVSPEDGERAAIVAFIRRDLPKRPVDDGDDLHIQVLAGLADAIEEGGHRR